MPALRREKEAAAPQDPSCTAELINPSPGTCVSCCFRHFFPLMHMYKPDLYCSVLHFFKLFFIVVVYASETNEICFCLLESMLYFPIIEHLVFVKCMMTLSNRKSASLSVPGQELTCATIFILKRYLKVQTKKVPAKHAAQW